LTPEAMVNGIIEAGYLNQGQICAAAERFYLPQGKLDAVLALLPSSPSDLDIIWRMALCGAGFGLFQSPNNHTIVASAPSH
ncbi:hypothetical protein QUH12_27735, partial [Klebsiella pneumoniae]|nr:hypothetical protein [Klebsiella pneumoniae]